jgi:hypothetical protein
LELYHRWQHRIGGDEIVLCISTEMRYMEYIFIWNLTNEITSWILNTDNWTYDLLYVRIFLAFISSWRSISEITCHCKSKELQLRSIDLHSVRTACIFENILMLRFTEIVAMISVTRRIGQNTIGDMIAEKMLLYYNLVQFHHGQEFQGLILLCLRIVCRIILIPSARCALLTYWLRSGESS